MPIGPIDILCILLVLSGLVFFFGASVGLLRFPDFYARMHAAGKGDTLSTLLIMAGAGLYELQHFGAEDSSALGTLLVVAKIIAIGVFIMLTSPTSTHALMQAGYDDGIEPTGHSGELTIEIPALGRAAATPTTPAAETKRATAKKSPVRKQAVPADIPGGAVKRKAAATKVAKKTATKKTAAKKTATKKVATKKVATKKVATKKTATRKTATKKTATKKAAAKKKKIAVKKKAPRRGGGD